MNTKRVAIVILNWNGRDFLERFLGRVIARSHQAQIIVVDNGSTDSSVEYVRANFAEVRLIELGQNYGFTGGYNRALRGLDFEFYVLLNSDIDVAECWLEPLIAVMDSDPTMAAAQPKILSYDHPLMFEYAGASGGFIDMLGYPFCRGRLIGPCEQDHGQYDTQRDIFWATGAAFMVRASMYHSSGGLDENFFAHQEEIDLCWRFHRQGLRIAVCPESRVYHVGAGTLPVWSPHKTYLNFRNNIAMLYKNLSRRRFALVLAVRMGTDSLRMFSYWATGKWSFGGAIFRGHRDFWKMRPKLDRQPQYGFAKTGNIYRGSIVLYYIFVSKNFDKVM